MEIEINNVSPEQTDETPETVSQPEETVEQTTEQPTVDGVDGQTSNTQDPQKKKKLMMCAAAAAVVLVAIIAVFVLPNLFKSVDGHLASGNYSMAYSKADDNRKEEVLLENAIACSVKEATDNRNRSDSDFLDGAWVYEEESGSKDYILHAGSGYYLYIYSDYNGPHYFNLLYTSDSDLLKSAKLPANPTTSDYSLAMVENAHKSIIIQAVRGVSSTKLSDEGVQRINNLYKKGKLKNAKVLKDNQIE